MAKVKLTNVFLQQGLVCPPAKKRTEFVDADLPGLYIEVLAVKPGQGTYYYRYKDTHNKSRHERIGRTNEMILAEARLKANQLKVDIGMGRDPYAAEQAKKAVITLDEFFAEQYLPYVKPRKRSWKRDEEIYRLRIKGKLGHKRLNELMRKEIQNFHASLLDESLAPATANLHLKLIKHALNLAVEWNMLDKNPSVGIPLLDENNRVENYLNPEELSRLVMRLKADPCRDTCNALLFLLSTGARLNEALQAKWEHFDIPNRVWRIPATNTKAKCIRSVPLNDAAIAILNEQDRAYTFVFTNKRTGNPYVNVNKVWMRIREEIGMKHLRIHDCRHNYASMLVNAGRTLYEVQQILGHSDPSVTTRYAHVSSKTLQDAANAASVSINLAMQGGA